MWWKNFQTLQNIPLNLRYSRRFQGYRQGVHSNTLEYFNALGDSKWWITPCRNVFKTKILRTNGSDMRVAISTLLTFKAFPILLAELSGLGSIMFSTFSPISIDSRSVIGLGFSPFRWNDSWGRKRLLQKVFYQDWGVGEIA